MGAPWTVSGNERSCFGDLRRRGSLLCHYYCIEHWKKKPLRQRKLSDFFKWNTCIHPNIYGPVTLWQQNTLTASLRWGKISQQVSCCPPCWNWTIHRLHLSITWSRIKCVLCFVRSIVLSILNTSKYYN